SIVPPPPLPTLFPYTTLFRSIINAEEGCGERRASGSCSTSAVRALDSNDSLPHPRALRSHWRSAKARPERRVHRATYCSPNTWRAFDFELGLEYRKTADDDLFL